jgi:hypothetical protein
MSPSQIHSFGEAGRNGDEKRVDCVVRLEARGYWPAVGEGYSADHWLDNWLDAVRSGPGAEHHADESALPSGGFAAADWHIDTV